ncbi:MAG TPA: hypothetical protein VFA34_08040 [Actinomycetota bacterium]|nr:hypothetical protein [Actinomycetota bacterium]
MTRRHIAYGLAAAAAYVGAAFALSASGVLPIRPLYDGLAPPAPYRYVRPPADLAEDNEKPLGARGALEVGKKGSAARSVPTGDGQMLVVFPEKAIPALRDETRVNVDILPVDPARLAAPPEGLKIDGNAYVVSAVYAKSKKRAVPELSVTVVLRYPMHATRVVRLDGRSWRPLGTQTAQASLQVFADSKKLGTFAAAGPPAPSRAWIAYVAAAGGVAAGVAGFLTGRRRSQRPKQRRKAVRRRRPQ